MVTINGKAFSFSISNHKHLARLEKARRKVARKYQDIAIPQNIEQSAKAMGRMAAAYITLLEGALGNGACNKLFGDEINDITVLVNAWGDFEAQLEQQAPELQKTAQMITAQLT